MLSSVFYFVVLIEIWSLFYLAMADNEKILQEKEKETVSEETAAAAAATTTTTTVSSTKKQPSLLTDLLNGSQMLFNDSHSHQHEHNHHENSEEMYTTDYSDEWPIYVAILGLTIFAYITWVLVYCLCQRNSGDNYNSPLAASSGSNKKQTKPDLHMFLLLFVFRIVRLRRSQDWTHVSWQSSIGATRVRKLSKFLPIVKYDGITSAFVA